MKHLSRNSSDRLLESEIADELGAHPDGEIFRSFFRSRDSVICAASLLGEIGDCHARLPPPRRARRRLRPRARTVELVSLGMQQTPAQRAERLGARHLPVAFVGFRSRDP